MDFLVAHMMKNLPIMREIRVQSLGQEDHLERLPTPVFLPGEFHGHRSLAGYSPSMGSRRVRHNRVTNTQRHTRFQQSQSLIHTQTSSPQPKCSRIPIFNLLIYQLSSMKILFKNLLIEKIEKTQCINERRNGSEYTKLL